jgi:hypothetical protein
MLIENFFALTASDPASEKKVIPILSDVLEVPDPIRHQVRANLFRFNNAHGFQLSVGVVASGTHVNVLTGAQKNILGFSRSPVSNHLNLIIKIEKFRNHLIRSRRRIRGGDPFFLEFLDMPSGALLIPSGIPGVDHPSRFKKDFLLFPILFQT